MKNPLTDEQLVRYLDGQLSAEQTNEIQDQLSNNPQLAAQLDALSVDTNGIREAFDSVVPLAPTVDLSSLRVESQQVRAQPVGDSKSRFTRLLPLAASVVLALGVGLVAGLNADRLFSSNAGNAGDAGSVVADWQQAVVDYQLLYVPGTLPAAAPKENDKRRQLMAISQAGGLSVTDTMVDLPGVDFRRAQTLGLKGSPLIQIAFAGPGGEPFALCFTPVEKPASKPVAQTIDGMNTVSWRNGAYGFILVSLASPSQVSAVASKAAELF